MVVGGGERMHKGGGSQGKMCVCYITQSLSIVRNLQTVWWGGGGVLNV